jgi:phosphoribosyl-AMP cyclohydrolase
VIARMNDNKYGMYMNNETFKEVDYDDNVVYLITERPTYWNVGESEVHQLEVKEAIESIQKLFYLNYCTTI